MEAASRENAGRGGAFRPDKGDAMIGQRRASFLGLLHGVGIAVATAAAWCLMSQAWSQGEFRRGARRPITKVIVGSEGKGLFTGAGVPAGQHADIRGTRQRRYRRA